MRVQGGIMSEKRYYWLKLMKDFFTNPKIKKLRKLAGGDTFTVIYLKLQLLSIDNEGVLIFQGIENTFEEEMALTIDEDIDNVSITLNYLMSQGLMEKLADNEYLLTETQYLIGSESSVTQRVRKHREAKKTLQCNTTETICNTEIEKEKEIETDKELDIDKNINTIACTEESEQAEQPVICIPLNNNTEYPIYFEFVQEMQNLYPNVDVMSEFRKMRGWSITNPKRRKTSRGVQSFINNWLAKAQDKFSRETQTDKPKSTGNPYLDLLRKMEEEEECQKKNVSV